MDAKKVKLTAFAKYLWYDIYTILKLRDWETIMYLYDKPVN
jgi:hypothetical protein